MDTEKTKQKKKQHFMKIKKKKDEAKETGPEKQYFLNNYE